MPDNSFQKAIVARILSTGQTGPEHEKTIQNISDWCRNGFELVEECSPDKRSIATQFDSFFLQYDATVFSNSEYGEQLFRFYNEINTYLTINSRNKTVVENILLTPTASLLDLDLLKNPNKNVYFLNTFSLQVFEKSLSNKPKTEIETIEYNVINLFDFINGDYNNFFDIVRVSEWDTSTPTNNLMNALLNSVGENGMLLFYDASWAGDLYKAALQMQESLIYPINKMISSRQDFHVTHLAGARGYVVAFKL